MSVEEEKKDFWIITVSTEVIQKVVFDKPLTMSEACEAYLDGDYDDIIDEEFVGEETIVGIE